jgi:hypothetical protein
MIAGPSALAAVLLLVSREPDRFWTWFAALTAAWLVSAAILLASGLLMEKLGPRALRALVRLTGMLLIMMAVQMLMDGVSRSGPRTASQDPRRRNRRLAQREPPVVGRHLALQQHPESGGLKSARDGFEEQSILEDAAGECDGRNPVTTRQIQGPAC